MEQVSYNLRLDLKDTGIVNTGFRLKQGDSGMKISVSIFNRGVNVFDSTTVPKIVFKRPDGASVMANMTIGSSVYEYVFVGNELQQPGVEIMDVKFTLPNDKRESTVSCSFVVVPDTITPNTHGSDIYDNDLAELVAEATAAAETVEEVVGDSEAWAVGERNGVPVGPEDPAYHNNSKWWSEQANVTSLAALTDVDLNNPADDDGLVYNSTEQKWKNKQITTKEQWKATGSYNDLPNNGTSLVQSGVTFTVNSNGTVTASTVPGSPASDNAGLYFFGSFASYIPDNKSGLFKLVGSPAVAGCSILYIVSADGSTFDSQAEDTGNGAILTAKGYAKAYIRVAKNADLSTPVTFKPMLTRDLNATYADYVPYAMTNRELTEKVSGYKILATASANQTFSAQMSTLYSTYNALSTEDKLLTEVWRDDNGALGVFHLDVRGDAIFSNNYVASDGSTSMIRFLRLSTPLAWNIKIATNGTVITENVNSSTNTAKLILLKRSV